MKLTTKQVHEIRERRAAGEQVKVLAYDYGKSQRTITDVAHGRTYAYVHGALPEPPLHKRVTPDEIRQMRIFIEAGGTVDACMTTFGRVRETVYKHAGDLLAKRKETKG